MTSSPAALATIRQHLEDLGREPEYYDRIVTGDLGQYGKELLLELARKEGLSLGGRLEDCGCLVFDNLRQDVHAGGSGCGCSASVFASFILRGIAEGKWSKVLFAPTGALMSPTSTQQGESIPSICHAVAIETTIPN